MMKGAPISRRWIRDDVSPFIAAFLLMPAGSQVWSLLFVIPKFSLVVILTLLSSHYNVNRKILFFIICFDRLSRVTSCLFTLAAKTQLRCLLKYSDEHCRVYTELYINAYNECTGGTQLVVYSEHVKIWIKGSDVWPEILRNGFL